jgi:hypothetical protein
MCDRLVNHTDWSTPDDTEDQPSGMLCPVALDTSIQLLLYQPGVLILFVQMLCLHGFLYPSLVRINDAADLGLLECIHQTICLLVPCLQDYPR